ncbi:MAG: zinc-ribbon domain-containing protein, partial [Planctomycetota bacterium]|nr:zinc-ribbon domain-containing protein [Planctomycetota bacterium]
MSTPRKQFCENCGQRLPEGARFCEICGRPVEGFHKRTTVVTSAVDAATRKSGRHKTQPAAPPVSTGVPAPEASAPARPAPAASGTSGRPEHSPEPGARDPGRPVSQPAAGPAAGRPAPGPGDQPAGTPPPPPAAAPSGASVPPPGEPPPAVRIEVVKRKAPKAAKSGDVTPPSGVPSGAEVPTAPGVRGAGKDRATDSTAPVRAAGVAREGPASAAPPGGVAASPAPRTGVASPAGAGLEKPAPRPPGPAAVAGTAKVGNRMIIPALAAAAFSVAALAAIAAYVFSRGTGGDGEAVVHAPPPGEIQRPAEPATASIGNRVRAVTTAAKGKATLKLSEVPAPGAGESGTFPLAVLGSYEVSMGEAAGFEDPVAIEIRYDPAILSGSQPVREQLMIRFLERGSSRWTWLRGSVDEAAGLVRTAVSRPGRFELVCLTAEPAPGGIGKAKWTAYHTPESVILYDRRAVESGGGTNDAAWKSKGGGRFPVASLKAGRESDETVTGYRRDVPECIQDVGYFIENALFAYGKEGFNLPPRPLAVRVETRPTGVEWRGKTPDRITIDLAGATSAEALRRAAARELFEAIQRLDYGPSGMDDARFAALRWWLAATAEYAACRVGGKEKTEAADAALLSRPLSGDSVAPDMDRERMHFIEYLVGLGVSFPGLHKAVADYSGGGNPVFRPLGALLRKATGADLPDVYRGFAAHFLFASAGPLGGRDPSKVCAEKADVFPLARETGAQAEPISHTLRVRRGYTAAVWAVRPEAVPTGSRKIVVEATDLSGRVAADIYLLEGNRPARTPPRRAGTLQERGDRRVIEAGTGDALYVV